MRTSSPPCSRAPSSPALRRLHRLVLQAATRPPTTTYQLSVAPTRRRRRPIAADLTVLTPRVRSGLDNDRIAALYPDRRLDYFAAARWSGPLDEVAAGSDAAGVPGTAALRNVDTDTSAFAGGYWLELDVVDFQAEYTGVRPAAAAPTVHVHLLARIGNADDRHVLGQVDADTRQRGRRATG